MSPLASIVLSCECVNVCVRVCDTVEFLPCYLHVCKEREVGNGLEQARMHLL